MQALLVLVVVAGCGRLAPPAVEWHQVGDWSFRESTTQQLSDPPLSVQKAAEIAGEWLTDHKAPGVRGWRLVESWLRATSGRSGTNVTASVA
jgi:hypothetical protein